MAARLLSLAVVTPTRSLPLAASPIKGEASCLHRLSSLPLDGGGSGWG
jgi:hypothetical protein